MEDTITSCRHCGTANPIEARFCIECGSGLEGGANTGATVKLPSKRCASCGGEAPPLARFCPLCGRGYEQEQAASVAGAPVAGPTASGQNPTPKLPPPSAANAPRRAPQIPWGLLALGLSLFLLMASRGRVIFFVAPLALATLSLGLSRHAWPNSRNGRVVGLIVFWIGATLALLSGAFWPGLLVVALIALAAGWLASQVR
jgi:ribosomal protein L40E